MKKIALLTSSRADYSIYLPLLKELKSEGKIAFDIIAFGSHGSPYHGETVKVIEKDGFKVKSCVESMVIGDSPEAVATSIGLTTMKFAQIWSAEKYDLIVCLGDRYEMFAAVSASVPFRIPVAHIHGGETTLGAIDNIYRHTLTHISQLHFVSTEKYKQKVVSLLGDSSHVYNVGAMSIDNLMEIELMSPETFLETFGIDLSKKSILITLHPETVAYEKNEIYVQELVKALKRLAENYQLIITMPNLDTLGSMIREELNTFISASEGKAIGVESFGTLGYLSCMKHCAFLLGNTSSGFVEASFFPKQVINLGERQSGRIRTPNILDCALEEAEIMKAVAEIEKSEKLEKIETYGTGQTAKKIHKILKQFL